MSQFPQRLVGKHLTQLTCCLAVIFAFGVASRVAADPVVTFNPATGGSIPTHFNRSLGWQFNVNTSLTVVGLGWFDNGANGLEVGHTVGIWDPSGALLASVFVPAGTVAPLDGQFRTVAIAPLVLPVGVGYIVGGEDFETNLERIAFNVTQTVDSHITYIGAAFSDNSGFTRPTNLSFVTTGGFYGPSFSVNGPATVPEPTTMLLLGSGLAGIAFKVRKRRKGV